MSTTTITSGEFNQDCGGAKKAAETGPVIITDHGKPSHVLMSYEEYQKLTGAKRSFFDVVAQDEDDDIDFDPPKMNNALYKSRFEFD